MGSIRNLIGFCVAALAAVPTFGQPIGWVCMGIAIGIATAFVLSDDF